MADNDTLIILGSSRSDGNTREAIRLVSGNHPVTLVDLSELDISYFDYEASNQGDDFLPLAERMVTHSRIVLATPVYWYSMSAIMKTFLDRWSDLIITRKDLGRCLKGKELFLVSSFAGTFPEGFELPFSQTCGYFDMRYGGCFYFYSGPDEEKRAQNELGAEFFQKRLWSS